MQRHDLAGRQFGAKAENYLTSTVHATGADLTRLTELAARSRALDALDLGCGAGHASFALARAGVARVVAYDLAPAMLTVVANEARARAHGMIEVSVGTAEDLAFADASFDLVVTRYSAHHWLDVPRALAEMARVLRPQGILVVIDVVAPEAPLLDTVLQTVEMLRDQSHVRDYRESEWRALFAAARFTSPTVDRWKLPMEFASWVSRIGTSAPRVAALEVVMDALPAEARAYFAVAADRSFVIDSEWFEATKR
jgi:ubiquinone/menaquinone biosynthesis C-methylase UbiE